MKNGVYGKLNTKKLNRELNEMTMPYSMERIFPYMTSRNKQKDSRYLISNFKRLEKTYRFCYELNEDCIALIKNYQLDKIYKLPEINNKLFVFTNIEDILTINCSLVYDTKYIFTLQYDEEIFNTVFNSIEKRSVSKTQLELIKMDIKSKGVLFNHIDGVSSNLLEEFLWRCRLVSTDIYPNFNNEVNLNSKRKKVETDFSILSKFEERILNCIYNIDKSYNLNEIWALLNEYYKNRNDLEIMIEIIDKKLTKWDFIIDCYEKRYRELFIKYKSILSLWKTQQIFKKYKKEYLYLKELRPKVMFFIEVFEDYDSDYLKPVSRKPIYSEKLNKNLNNKLWKTSESKEEFENRLKTKRKSLISEENNPSFILFKNYDSQFSYLPNNLLYSKFKEIYKNYSHGKDYHKWINEHKLKGHKILYLEYSKRDPKPLTYKEWKKLFDSMTWDEYNDWYFDICPF